ncbi:hypothetical protein ABI59_01260 [Acidobacteria bacterium Mor1]|nr:hypothetical protein ABI59_01260 [Acidobacteria bacterium Mor1]
MDASGGVTVLRCRALDALEVPHAFSTRRDGDRDDFDLGPAEPEEPRFVERRGRLAAAAGVPGSMPVLLRQVHEARMVPSRLIDPPEEADASYALSPELGGSATDLLPAVRTADCVPILLADRAGRAVAAVHAGWRGTAAGIATKAVMELARLGVPPIELVAAIGPCIGPSSYEVSAEVAEQVACTSGEDFSAPAGEPGKRMLDLARANRRQLSWSGLEEGNIHVAPFCTALRSDLFFSYRRDGAAAGRMMALAGLPARA